MMNRINTFLFLTVLTATISVISIASAEEQESFTWFGDTYLSGSDSPDGSLKVQGFRRDGEFSITSVHLHRATLRCRNSQVYVDMEQELPGEYQYSFRFNEKANLFVVQAVGVDGNTTYAVKGTIQSADDSFLATVTVARSHVFFTEANDAARELCTARLAVRAPRVIE